MINNFDLSLLLAVNKYAQQSLTFDHLLAIIQSNYLFKGGVLVPLVYFTWFKADQYSIKRNYLIATLLCTFPAELLARLLAKTLPFRLRPIHDTTIHFLPPFGMGNDIFDGLSSFPSDHAVLFFCLSAGLFLSSKKLGIFAFIYTIIFIAFPRLYLGLHFASDLICGAIIGIILAVVACVYFSQCKLVNTINKWSYTKPEFFYPLFFLFTCEVFEMFGSSRALLKEVFEIFQ